MKYFRVGTLVLMTLLGASAGAVKVIRMPQEVEFFQALGMGTAVVVLFGAIQIAGSILLVPIRSRIAGAAILAVSFLASAVMLLATGAIGFGIFSLLPVVLSLWLLWDATADEKAA